ncbi:hypothetical protein L208DRAFT_1482073 [Tricholoma matsutake]|nr:hypothetical protein L208DRAFT_1482073 [Tricholoma matsutake 945]
MLLILCAKKAMHCITPLPIFLILSLKCMRFILELVNTLGNSAGKGPLDCLAIFCHMMVNVVVYFSYGYCLGTVSKFALDVEDPLSTVINNFPKCGIL